MNPLDGFFTSGPDRILLAPMEGVVDASIRQILTDIGGIDLCITEFIRITDRLLPISEFLKDCPELLRDDRTPSGIPVLVQLLGGQPGPLGENAARAVELGALGIDLNFGCPAKTVNRHDGGATLLKNPTRIFDVVTAVRAAVPAHIPVSAKVRLGFSDKEFHLDIARAAEAAGAAWLTVHARTRDEGYRPPAHWEFINWMREVVSMPVIANGDIWTVADAKRARSVSGCRHIMIGRGLLSDPFLARELKGGQRGSWPEAVEWFTKHVHMSITEQRGGTYASSRAKQWLKSLGRRFPEAAQAFETVKRLESPLEILQFVQNTECEIDETNQPRSGYNVTNKVTDTVTRLEGV
jgi:tRNA-dihydrouridine synthase C